MFLTVPSLVFWPVGTMVIVVIELTALTLMEIAYFHLRHRLIRVGRHYYKRYYRKRH